MMRAIVGESGEGFAHASTLAAAAPPYQKAECAASRNAAPRAARPESIRRTPTASAATRHRTSSAHRALAASLLEAAS